jgi:hypothetical protein
MTPDAYSEFAICQILVVMPSANPDKISQIDDPELENECDKYHHGALAENIGLQVLLLIGVPTYY